MLAAALGLPTPCAFRFDILSFRGRMEHVQYKVAIRNMVVCSFPNPTKALGLEI